MTQPGASRVRRLRSRRVESVVGSQRRQYVRIVRILNYVVVKMSDTDSATEEGVKTDFC